MSMAPPNSAIPSHTTVISQQQLGQNSGNPTPDTPGYSPSYNGHSGKATGWIQLCCAVAMILVGLAQFLLGSPIRILAIGIWTGFMCYGPAGILGIKSSRKRTSVITAYLTMSVFSAILALVMMCLGTSSVIMSQPCYREGIPCKEGLWDTRIASDAIMIIVGFIEMIVAIVGSVHGCAGVCCGNKSSRPVQEINVIHHYPVVASTNQQGVPHIPTDQPPPSMASPVHHPSSYTPQQQQQIYPPEQTFPQQTNAPQQTIPQQPNAPQQTIPQQTNAPQQTFPQQQTLAHPETSTQHHYTELQTYQPLMNPNNQGRQNSGFAVNLPQR